ncbi:MAG: tetratricopeptide repeat protein [Phycisphaerales bacterium]|nr:tetratricopeptide repeat protein [Phycisphaerales bacterium]
MKQRTTLLVGSAAVVICVLVVVIFVVLRTGGESETNTSVPPGTATGVASTEDEAKIREILEAASQRLSAGQYGPAQRMLEETIAQYGQRAQFYELLYQAHLGQGRFEEAYSTMQAAINLGEATAEMHDAAAMAANRSGYIEEAAQHYALAASIDQQNPKYPLYRAQILIKLGQFDEARRYLLVAATLDPQQEYAWGTLAQLALRDNRPNVALQYIAKARAVNPHRTIWMIEQSKAHRRNQEPERGVMLLSGLPPAQLDEPGVLSELAMCFAMLDRPIDAALAWADHSERSPNDWQAAIQTAEWFQRAGEHAQAIHYAQVAIVLAPDEPQPRELLARLQQAAIADDE